MRGSAAAVGPRREDRAGLQIALYSHDTMGIGHLRRNLRIAQHLAIATSPACIMLITGAREAGCFPIPPGVDCLTLPSLRKDEQGQYCTRSLGITLERLIQLRSVSLAAALKAFDPDLLIVDKVPRGALNELDPALEILRGCGRTKCVLGLRDVLDDPATVRREWKQQQAHQALHEYYDAIWIYGDPHVYDPVREYGWAVELPLAVRYAGYLNPYDDHQDLSKPAAETTDQWGLPPGPLALCVVGGGQDGAALAAAFCDARLPPDMNGVIVTGPFMPADLRESVCFRSAGRPRFRVLEFVADLERLMRSADRVISMGGYNTVCEVLALGKPALIVPRVKPRREQLIRAMRLCELNLVDVLLPDALTPAALSEWLWRELPSRPPAREHIDFRGLTRLPDFVQELIASSPVLPAAPRMNMEYSHVTS
jgi:predicted glycosyltransferase